MTTYSTVLILCYTSETSVVTTNVNQLSLLSHVVKLVTLGAFFGRASRSNVWESYIFLCYTHTKKQQTFYNHVSQYIYSCYPHHPHGQRKVHATRTVRLAKHPGGNDHKNYHPL